MSNSMWIVLGVIAIVIVVLVAGITVKTRRSAKAGKWPTPTAGSHSLPPVHALDDALRTVESLTDATGSSLLDQVDRDGRTIRDRLASGEAHLDSLRQPDDTGPLLGRVLDEVTGQSPSIDIATPAATPPATPPAPGA
jgi:hypothetical protein